MEEMFVTLTYINQTPVYSNAKAGPNEFRLREG